MIRFPSLLNPATTGYTIQESWRELFDHGSTARRRYLADWAGKYETYGDRDVQHSMAVPAVDLDFADYCLSLSRFALADPEAGRMLTSKVLAPLLISKVRFLAKIRHDPAKVRWYSRSDEAVSSARSRAHDRRWEEVPTWADGSPGAIYGMYGRHDSGLIAAFGAYRQIVDHLEECRDVAGLLDLGHEWERPMIRNAFEALLRASRSRSDAELSARLVDATVAAAEARRARIAEDAASPSS